MLLWRILMLSVVKGGGGGRGIRVIQKTRLLGWVRSKSGGRRGGFRGKSGKTINKHLTQNDE